MESLSLAERSLSPTVAPALPVRPAPDRRPRAGTILLVNPFYPKDPRTSFGKHVLAPSLALPSIAAATPQAWRVRFWDENLLQGPAPSDPIPEVVGITVHTAFAYRAYALAARFRSMGSTVVLGGLHVSACPDEASEHADVTVVGEGTSVWSRLLDDLRRGRLRKRYDGFAGGSYATVPVPDRSVLPRRAFLTTGSVIASRGCNNRCSFCYLATDGVRTPYQTRRVADIVAEIRATGERYVVFTDNNLTASHEFVSTLCRALRPLGIIWSAAVTIDAARDEMLLRNMADAGCQGVFVGFESIDGRNLRDAGKRTMPPHAYPQYVKRFHDVGIQVNGSFVFGFDHDTREVFRDTVRWVEQNRLECATFHILTPYPGTPLFAQLDAEGRLLHRDWSRYDTAHAVFLPQQMQPEELEAGYAWAYRSVFSDGSIWRRRPRGVLSSAPYLAMAYLYKRANPLWTALIRGNLTRWAWAPLVTASWIRHSVQSRWLSRAVQHRARTGDSLPEPCHAPAECEKRIAAAVLDSDA